MHIHRLSWAQPIVLSVLLSAFHLSLYGSISSAADASRSTSGMVIALEGDVWITNQSGRMTPAEGFVLQEGDTVWVRTGGLCKGFSPGGESFTLDGPAQLVLSPASESRRGGGVSAWISNAVKQWIGESRPRPLTTRSARSWDVSQGACIQISPAEGGRAHAESVTFYWTTIPGVDRYGITIAPASGAEIKHLVRGHSLTMEGLVPGAEYVWRVNPIVRETEVEGSWTSFRILSAEEERSLAAAIENRPDLEAGVLLLTAGLHEEAVDRLDAAVSSGSDRRSALRWRAQALSAMGQHAAAYSDLLESTTRP